MAVERLKPDIEREIITMKHDKKEYGNTCIEISNSNIDRAEVYKRTYAKEAEFQEFKTNQEGRYNVILEKMNEVMLQVRSVD